MAIFGPARAADNPLAMPGVGSGTLRLLTPTLLELGLISTKQPPPARLTTWTYVTADQQLLPPSPSDFEIRVDGQPVAVNAVGFRRRPLYAPFKKRDLRIGNYLYLVLATPVSDGSTVQVTNPDHTVWGTNVPSSVVADPRRWSPAIHASQVGYLPNHAKTAFVGYFLGSFGEMTVPAATGFQLVDTHSGAPVYSGNLVGRQDAGYQFSPAPYQQVLEADFGDFTTPGEYQLFVPGLGTSFHSGSMTGWRLVSRALTRWGCTISVRHGQRTALHPGYAWPMSHGIGRCTDDELYGGEQGVGRFHERLCLQSAPHRPPAQRRQFQSLPVCEDGKGGRFGRAPRCR